MARGTAAGESSDRRVVRQQESVIAAPAGVAIAAWSVVAMLSSDESKMGSMAEKFGAKRWCEIVDGFHAASESATEAGKRSDQMHLRGIVETEVLAKNQ